MRVKLHDCFDYLVLTPEIGPALPQVIVWGSHAYIKVSKRKYQESTLLILTDTKDDLRPNLGA